MSHTEGPITVRTSPHISLPATHYRELIATTEDGECVLGEVFYSDVGEEVATANAALFAAAPDLLAALKQAVQCLEPDVFSSEYEAARAAIARATGAGA